MIRKTSRSLVHHKNHLLKTNKAQEYFLPFLTRKKDCSPLAKSSQGTGLHTAVITGQDCKKKKVAPKLLIVSIHTNTHPHRGGEKENEEREINRYR